jgi:hypothetical protein
MAEIDRATQDTLKAEETFSLISADKVEGTAVYNTRGDKLGSIHSVMIDKIGGRVGYAVMSFGGFLGIGERYHPLPWSMLRYDQEQDGYVVDIDRNVLEGAPAYAEDELRWDDPKFGPAVDDYYGAPPFMH